MLCCESMKTRQSHCHTLGWPSNFSINIKKLRETYYFSLMLIIIIYQLISEQIMMNNDVGNK